MNTIPLDSVADGVYAWAPDSSELALPWSNACDLLGITSNRTTRNRYRQWLGLEQGQLLSPAQVLELDLVVKFSTHGGGRYFSRRNFIRLKGHFKEEVRPAVLAAMAADATSDEVETAVEVTAIAQLAAFLREKYGITPNPDIPKVNNPIQP